MFKSCRYLLATVLCLLVLHPIAAYRTFHTGSHGSVLFVMDASGSMGSDFGGDSRLSIARRILLERLLELPREIPTGLVAYGNGIKGCKSARIYSPIKRGERMRISRAARYLAPSGNTPLAHTLQLIRTRIVPSSPNLSVVIISDGAETCGGNPNLEARLLRRLGVRIYIIGMTSDRMATKQLRSVAKDGAGQYFPAGNERELERALSISLPRSGMRYQRSRRNRRAELKWDFRSAVRPALRSFRGSRLKKKVVPTKTGFVITGIDKSSRTSTATVYRISFQFRVASPGDYVAVIRIQGSAKPSGRRVTLTTLDAIELQSGMPFYETLMGHGSVDIAIPDGIRSRKNVFAQGELWSISNIPVTMGLSNSVKVL